MNIINFYNFFLWKVKFFTLYMLKKGENWKKLIKIISYLILYIIRVGRDKVIPQSNPCKNNNSNTSQTCPIRVRTEWVLEKTHPIVIPTRVSHNPWSLTNAKYCIMLSSHATWPTAMHVSGPCVPSPLSPTYLMQCCTCALSLFLAHDLHALHCWLMHANFANSFYPRHA